MEALIALLILIGVLSIGGNSPDKATRDSVTRSSGTTLAEGRSDSGVACRDPGPHQRDLTVPFTSRRTSTSVDPEACDD